MHKSESPRNLLDRIRGSHKVCPIIEQDTDPNLDTQDDNASLTARRRKFVMSHPVHNKTTAAKFKSARNKIKGLLLWNKMRAEIQVYGTSSNLFDVYDTYKQHLSLIMKQKQRDRKVAIEMPKWPRGLFSPESRFKQVWNLLVILLLMYTFILTPFLIAFEEVEIGSSWFIVDTVVDTCFFLDIIFTLNTAYICKEGTYVLSRKQIFFKYLKGMLVIDFLSVFPFYLLGKGASARSNVFIRFLRMARLTRIVRASKIINIIKHFSNSDTMESLVNFLKTYSGVTRLITAVFVVLLITHFSACMWYYSARLDDFNPDTWVVRYNFQDDNRSKLYISALYWSLTTLTTVGYGDISAYTTGEQVICMLWMMFGVGFYSFTVGTLSSVLSSMDAKSSMINTKLSLIELFAKDTDLPDDLVKRISKFVKSQSENTTLDEKQRQVLLMQLPKILRYEIAMSMHCRSASKIDFFKSQDIAFVANIVPLLQQITIPDSEFIYIRGDHPEEVYFIVKGKVNFMYGPNSVFKTTSTGSYFGEIELLEQIPREFSTMSEDNCEFMLMNRAIFEEVMKEYPKIAAQIKEAAAERKVQYLESQYEFVEMLKRAEILKEGTFEEHPIMEMPIKIKDRRSKSVSDTTIPNEKGSENQVFNGAKLNIFALRRELEGLKSLADSVALACR